MKLGKLNRGSFVGLATEADVGINVHWIGTLEAQPPNASWLSWPSWRT